MILLLLLGCALWEVVVVALLTIRLDFCDLSPSSPTWRHGGRRRRRGSSCCGIVVIFFLTGQSFDVSAQVTCLILLAFLPADLFTLLAVGLLLTSEEFERGGVGFDEGGCDFVPGIDSKPDLTIIGGTQAGNYLVSICPRGHNVKLGAFRDADARAVLDPVGVEGVNVPTVVVVAVVVWSSERWDCLWWSGDGNWILGSKTILVTDPNLSIH